MARKKSSRQAKSFGEAIGLQYLYNNEKIDFFLGLILFVVAIYMIISMVSFFSTGAADQSMMEHLHPSDWLNDNMEFRNRGGSLGAMLSYFFITECFGIPSFLIPGFLLLVALQLMRAYKINLWKWFLGMAVTMIWCSVAFAQFLTPILGDQVFNPGGNHGVFCVDRLTKLVGTPGLNALLLLVAIVFITFLSSETITVIRKALNPVDAITSKVKFYITNKQGDAPSSTIDETEASPAMDTASTVVDLDRVKEGDEEESGAVTVDLTHMGEDAGKADGEPLSDRSRGARTRHGAADQETGMEISVAKDVEKANGDTVGGDIDKEAPINPRDPFQRYQFPTLSLLKTYDNDSKPYIDEQEQMANKNRIIEVLDSFGVKIRTIRATVGPTITLYEIQPAEGIRISKIKNLEDDIALSLAALGIRIIAPMPGKGTIGIEVPNAKPNIVSMESILNSKKFKETQMQLPIALGKTITNDVFMVDLTKIPHLLVAGATGQGKSVGLNAVITSLLYKKHPNELKFVLIDPKKVEFSIYAKIAPHFMAVVDEDEDPIITDVTKVVRTLKSLCTLMDHRYDLLKMAGARNIKEYNDKFVHRRLDLTKGHDYMPYIVVIIDEFGDLIMTAGKEIEMPIARIAQLARAVGIHMIIATQRPTTNIITGNIKANFPGRIAFKVSAGVDSKTILDRTGAQQLIGRGDMLYVNGSEPVRVQCAFVDTPEVEHICDYIAAQPGPVEPLILPEPAEEAASGGGGGVDAHNFDPLFVEAAHAIVATQSGSTSMIQRRFSIGYNRAGRLMDQLEQAGIVGQARGAKPRDVLIVDENQLNSLLEQVL